MKHGPNNRRARSRGNGRRPSSPSRNHSFESNGPEVKVRGTAQQVQEKYLALARDAYSAGDRIGAEGYFQFAEHYYRVIHANAQNGSGGNGQNRGDRRQGPEGVPQQAEAAPAPGGDPAAEPQPQPPAPKPEPATP